jgi:hypothetical protein
MSEQFRLTVRQLFTSRLLFVAQAQATFHGGKRYSLILVDVETIEAVAAKRRKSLNWSAPRHNHQHQNNPSSPDNDDHRDPQCAVLIEKPSVGRQVSFPSALID